MSLFKREDLRRVFFSDLSEHCNEDLIHELCVQFGPVANITWPTTNNLGGAQQMTFCFVDFYSAEDAKYCYEALYRSNMKLFNKTVRVSHASTEMELKESGARVHSRRDVHALHEIGAKVVVRGVDPTVTEFELTSFFSQFGRFAVPPRMLRDFEGNFRGTVILSYDDFASSDRVIEEMHQKVYRDRPISVSYAELLDGSGRLHGSEEERANAALFREEARKHAERIAREQQEHERERARRRQQNVAWASGIDPYGRPR
ncbi:putative RNA recognition motif (a k a RRM RBD or RNP domain) [Trypanosoma vivax]|uniref:Putative RNA-binding protein n=1 Tax=Trypanosoma vivax (strain Y486) TaxID=1055687 RepID=G0TTL4_TRYVY|nr:putative RNA-binding protein [Trypanosoma vivax]KAH8606972.1 putative RNA recognition motif (a k a RRM RBD or RNP domain) [Trypanosoma vivax]CCC47295.1 putative RNA-binding protein [Trypanosoma vivax Y486]